MTTKQARYDARRRAEGDERVSVWVDAETRSALLRAFSGQPMSMQAMVTMAIEKFTEVGITLVRPEPFGSPGGSVLRDASQPDADVIRRAAKLR